MIIDFGVKNFYNFLGEQHLTFKLGPNCPNSISNGDSISKILCFKGANASGKTNALKILPLFAKLLNEYRGGLNL